VHNVQNIPFIRPPKKTFTDHRTLIKRPPANVSINQSINLSVLMQNKHWTGHQGRMQPPLTGDNFTA